MDIFAKCKLPEVADLEQVRLDYSMDLSHQLIITMVESGRWLGFKQRQSKRHDRSAGSITGQSSNAVRKEFPAMKDETRGLICFQESSRPITTDNYLSPVERWPPWR